MSRAMSSSSARVSLSIPHFTFVDEAVDFFVVSRREFFH
jgi:hypothetical protein